MIAVSRNLIRRAKESRKFCHAGVPQLVPISNIGQADSILFGNMATISSTTTTERNFVKNIGLLKPSLDTPLWIRGRVSAKRIKGNMCFVVIRCGSLNTVQAFCFKNKADSLEVQENTRKLLDFIADVPLESIVDIQGKAVAATVKSCSVKDCEIHVQKFLVVSRAPTVLPFSIEDASNPVVTNMSIPYDESSEVTGGNVSTVPQLLRLNNRWLDLRVPAHNSIFRIQSAVGTLFREALLFPPTSPDDSSHLPFVEIHTPKLLPGNSEGGADVFRVPYFDKLAALAQSPQLYKQMAISADFQRVFEIGPVFRAENSHTRRHLCEFTGLDMEMEIMEHYSEALEVVHGIFKHIFTGLESRFPKELESIRAMYPSEPARITDEPLVIHWMDGIQMLRESGFKIEDEMADLTGAAELALGELVSQKYNADFFILDQYPSSVRPFYTMRNPLNPLFSNSYDMFIRGQEICSGAQRQHNPELLIEQMKARGVDPGPLASYIDSFRHAVSPHAGAGIGLERVVFLYLGLDNIRKSSLFPRDPNRLAP